MDKNKLLFEGIWWLITALAVSFVLLPIFRNFPDFPFLIANIAYVVVFVTAARYTFLLEYTYLGGLQIVKIALVLFCVGIISLLLFKMQDFQVWADNNNPEILLATVKASKRESLFNYIKSEYLFFAIGSVIAQLFLTGRLIKSIWRLRNRGTI